VLGTSIGANTVVSASKPFAAKLRFSLASVADVERALRGCLVVVTGVTVVVALRLRTDETVTHRVGILQVAMCSTAFPSTTFETTRGTRDDAI
jgi:hypothetical protein